MARNVALSEKAYRTLSILKRKKESFSDVVLRVAREEKAPLSRFVGIWKEDPEIKKIYDDVLSERHEKKARWVSV